MAGRTCQGAVASVESAPVELEGIAQSVAEDHSIMITVSVRLIEITTVLVLITLLLQLR